jgi:hypothetical protein
VKLILAKRWDVERVRRVERAQALRADPPRARVVHILCIGPGADRLARCTISGMVLDLRHRIEVLSQRAGPVVTLADADAVGVSRAQMRRCESLGITTRIGKSAFVLSRTLEDADAWEAFRLRSIGFAVGSGDDVYLAGASVQAVLGLPSLGEPPPKPVALRPGNAHRGPDRTPYGRIRTGHLPPYHRWTRSGVRVVSLEYAAVDVARHTDHAEALSVLDHALHRGADRESLSLLAKQMSRYPGIELARWAIQHGDERVESPLESLGRLAFLEAGRPAPLSNVWIFDDTRAYRADLLIPDTGVVLEGDGNVKYHDRSDAASVIADQVARERWLRRRGYGVERFDHGVARFRREQIVIRADQAARQRGDRPPPQDWSLDPPARLVQWFARRTEELRQSR